MVKIIATSDLHGTLPEIPACDLLIIAGDVCPVCDHESKYQNGWLRHVFSPWLLDCIEKGAKNIVWTPGNHDFVLEGSDQLRAEMNEVEPNVHFLIDKEITIEGLRIYCTPWTPHLPNWAFAAEDYNEALAKFESIPNGLDILVSHGPPTGFGDSVSHAGHVGCDALRDIIKLRKPALTLCGHIHEGFGHYLKDGIEVINVSYLDELYEPTHKLVELEVLCDND